jgi:hypothetical protein
MASSSNDNPESFAALGLYPDVYSFLFNVEDIHPA